MIKELYHFRNLISELVKRDIKKKYRRSVLGYLWSMLNPLLMMLITAMVFSHLFRFDIPNYPLYLLTGQIIFTFYSEATNFAMGSILENGGLIKKVYVPKYLYTLSGILYNFIIFLISLIVLVVVAAVLGLRPSIYMLQAPVPLLLLLILSVGCGFILATLGVFFRDLEYLWSVALMLIMYTCAIFYPVEKLIKSGWAWILKYNPLFCIIDLFRSAVFGQPMNMGYLLYAFGFGIVTVIVGLIMFVKKQDEFILHL